MRKKKVLILEISHAKGGGLAGGDKLMEPMAAQLTNQYNFTAITTRIGAKHWLEAPFDKEVFTLPGNNLDHNVSPVAMFLNYCIRIYQATKLVTKTRASILYSSNDTLPDILPLFILKVKNPKLFWVARLHHLIPNPFSREGNFLVNLITYLLQKFSLRLMRRANLILLLNKKVRQNLIYAGFSASKLQVLGAGIDFESIKTQEISPNTPFFDGVFLGRLHRTKGIFDLIPIWSAVVKQMPHAKLAIIGDGQKNIIEKLKLELSKTNLEKSVEIFGFLPTQNVISLMKQAKVFLFTDHEAGFGLAVLESMACGLPVIGWDIGVLDSIFEGGFIKIPPKDYQKFSQAVSNLLQDHKLRASVKKQAVSEASKFRWKEIARKFDNLVNSFNE